MTLSQSPTLSALIARYEHAVVFAESVPSALRIAKTFCEMRWSNGGIVLLGVEANGQVRGVDKELIPAICDRFKQLCSELTRTRVEIGTISMGSLDVVFLVFNPVPKNTMPIEDYHTLVHDVVFS